ncbi:hypothetical protein AB1Y20_022766 [Prymnesium parvum]|uniref:YTH domain-containing protein n=1 Tax=Prymnesium parvum TaxID=97485 RepID=A0AB34JIU7_PRYPA
MARTRLERGLAGLAAGEKTRLRCSVANHRGEGAEGAEARGGVVSPSRSLTPPPAAAAAAGRSWRGQSTAAADEEECAEENLLEDIMKEGEDSDWGEEEEGKAVSRQSSHSAGEASDSPQGASGEAGTPLANGEARANGSSTGEEPHASLLREAADRHESSGGDATGRGEMSSAPREGGPREEKGWPSKRLPPRTRFFIMKSFSERDVKLSMQKGIWATQQRNEAKLNAAYEEADAVVLFFSVNESRAWQGYAKMASRTGESAQVWTAVDGTQSWGGVFKVKWQTIYDLSFQSAIHLRNPLNENKPIKISRDGQEVEPSVGFAMARLFDEGYVANPSQSMKRRKLEDMATGPPGKGNGHAKGGGYGGNSSYGGFSDYKGKGGPSGPGPSAGGWRGKGVYAQPAYQGGGKGWHGDGGKGKGGGRPYECGGVKRPREPEGGLDITNMSYEEYLALRHKRHEGGAQGGAWGGGCWGGAPSGGPPVWFGQGSGYGYGGYGEPVMHSNYGYSHGWR